MPVPDYYAELQVDAAADPEVVEAAYRRLARKLHPDRNPGPDAHRAMQRLNDAYAVLSDPARRAEYDRRRAGRNPPPPHTSAPHPPADEPGSFPGSGSAGPTPVPCEKCRAMVSDEAETCPGCGHPQPPLAARERGEELDRCPHCRALNPVRNYRSFRDRDVCRGCGRAVLEIYPRQRFEARVDEVYRWYVSAWGEYRWAIVGASVVACAAVSFYALRLIGSSWAAGGAIVGAVVGFYACEAAFSEACRAFWAGSGTPLHPDDGRPISREDWGRASSRHGTANRVGSPPAGPDRPWWRSWVMAAAGFAAVWYFTPGGPARKTAAEDREAAAGAAMAAKIAAGKSEGTFTTDVYLTNGSDAGFGTCELTLTVYFETGKRADVPRFWADWAGRETKTVNFPAGGRVERVDLKGTMVDSRAGARGRVDTAFEWKGKPTPVGPGK